MSRFGVETVKDMDEDIQTFTFCKLITNLHLSKLKTIVSFLFISP